MQKLSKEEINVYRLLGVTGKKVSRYTVIRLNTLLGVSSNRYIGNGNYFKLHGDNLTTFDAFMDSNLKLIPKIISEENSTIYSSSGKPSTGGRKQDKIRRTIRWKLLISKGCNLSTPPYFIRTYTQKDIVPENRRIRSAGEYKWINDGHLISKSILKKVGITDRFVEASNMNNIYAQTERANLHSSSDYGQKYFEDLVIQYIDDLEENKYLYYEVEAIFSSKNDRVPIGNKLLCLERDAEKKEDKEKFFVFIPNYQENHRIDYRNGF